MRIGPLSRTALFAALAAMASVAAAIGIVPAASADDALDFQDGSIRECVASALGQQFTQAITATQMASLTSLECSGYYYSLVDLATATNLEHLGLGGGFATEGGTTEEVAYGFAHMLDPLAGLTDLRSLRLPTDGQFPVDLSPLGGLSALETLLVDRWDSGSAAQLGAKPNLTSLTVSDNIQSLQGIGAYPSLTKVHLIRVQPDGGGNLSLEPVAALHKLNNFEAFGAIDAGDFSMFAGATGLTDLTLTGATFTGFEGLAGLDSLQHLYVVNSPVTDDDLAVAAALPNLTTLNLTGGSISNLTPLTGNTKLTWLGLWANEISDIGVLATLTSLQTAVLSHNHISDFSPLADLPLTDYGAEYQTVDLGTVQACAVVAPQTFTTRAGEVMPFLPNAGLGMTDGTSVVWSRTGDLSIQFEYFDWNPGLAGYYDRAFGTATLHVLPVEGGCAWGAGSSVAATLTTVDGNPKLHAEITWAPGMHPEAQVQWVDSHGTVLKYGADWQPAYGDLGSTVTAHVVAISPTFANTFLESSSFTLLGTVPATLGVQLDFAAEVDRTVNAIPIDKPSDIPATYQWLLDGQAIPGATLDHYTPVLADQGHQLSVTMYLVSSKYHPAQATSEAATVAAPWQDAGAQGSIAGATDVGSTLQAVPPVYMPTPTGRSYQWSRNGVPITGATAATYTLKSLDAGMTVSVKVTSTRAGYTALTNIYSVSVHRVFSVPVPKIVGTAKVGKVLTASRGTWHPTPSTVKYQWYRDGKAIAGATSYKHTVTSSDDGHSLKVKVTGSKSGYTTLAKVSAGVAARR